MVWTVKRLGGTQHKTSSGENSNKFHLTNIDKFVHFNHVK